MMQTLNVAGTRKSEVMPLPVRPRVATRILIADDDSLVRAAVQGLFSTEKGFKIVGEAHDGKEALALAQRMSPEVLLLDLNMPGLTGLETVGELAQAMPQIKTVLLTISLDDAQKAKALSLGVRGVVLKEKARRELVEAVEAVQDGMYWVDGQPVSDPQPIIADLEARSQKPASRLTLSAKETQIVHCIVDGYTNKDIAKCLATSEQVVKNHLGRIFDKLGVFNRLELALYAIDHGLAQRH